MADQVDWEMAARLTLYESLFVHMFANEARAMPDGGRDWLKRFGEEVVEFVAQRTRFPRTLSEDEQQEWRMQVGIVTERMFSRAEVKRQEFLRDRGTGRPG